MKNLITRVLAAFALTVLWVSSAFAVPIAGENEPENNTAEFTWEVVDSNLDVTIDNTCNFNCLITGFQFTIMDDVAGTDGTITVTGTLDDSGWSLTTDVTGCTATDCAITGNNLNGGDPQDGIAAGGTGVFAFGGEFADPSNLADIMVRFQQTGSDGEGSDRGYVCEGDCKPPEVQEPGPLALLGLGLLAVGLRRELRARASRS